VAVKPGVVAAKPGVVAAKPVVVVPPKPNPATPVKPLTAVQQDTKAMPLCTKPFSMTDPSIQKIGNHFVSTVAGKACKFNQKNGLKYENAPECPAKPTRTWTANGFEWGSAVDKNGEYDCRNKTKPLQCSQMASSLGKTTMYNGKKYFTGKEKDGRNCVFLSHLKTAADNSLIYPTATQCDDKAYGFEEDKTGKFWGWSDTLKRKCLFREAKK
jgi:hypothetical protein